MTLAVVPKGPTLSMPDLLDQLQQEQFHHDESYHREIARLSMHNRLKHLGLHFCKYVGRLSDAEISKDDRRRVLLDCLIIATSSANTLNLRLAEHIGKNPRVDNRNVVSELAMAAGRFAEACEKLDHIEDFAFRPMLAESTLRIWTACMETVAAHENIYGAVAGRLAQVKRKSIFHPTSI